MLGISVTFFRVSLFISTAIKCNKQEEITFWQVQKTLLKIIFLYAEKPNLGTENQHSHQSNDLTYVGNKPFQSIQFCGSFTCHTHILCSNRNDQFKVVKSTQKVYCFCYYSEFNREHNTIYSAYERWWFCDFREMMSKTYFQQKNSLVSKQTFVSLSVTLL